MRLFLANIARFLKGADGPTTVEYCVILALIFLVCITAVVIFGQATNSSFQHSSDQINASFGSH
jgi:pilus assembly protein Flp/PilA